MGIEDESSFRFEKPKIKMDSPEYKQRKQEIQEASRLGTEVSAKGIKLEQAFFDLSPEERAEIMDKLKRMITICEKYWEEQRGNLSPKRIIR